MTKKSRPRAKQSNRVNSVYAGAWLDDALYEAVYAYCAKKNTPIATLIRDVLAKKVGYVE
jgi:hypothetical protein